MSSTYTYTRKEVSATPRNKRYADAVSSSGGSSYVGASSSDYTNYWTLIDKVTDSDGNVTTLAQPYIITSYPVVSEQDITAFGAGEGGDGLKISDLADVDVSGIADNYVLVWDAINSKWVTKAQSGGVTTVFTSTANGLVPMSGTTSTSKYLNANGGWTTPSNTTYSFASASSSWGWAVSGGASFSWTHPSATAYSSGLYKVTVDAYGHVTSATSVSKSDITNLGIPSSDTNTTYALSKSGSTITLTSSDGSTTSVTDSDTTYSRDDMVNTIGVFGINKVGLVPAGGMVSTVLMNYGDWGYPDIVESTYGNHYRFFDSGNPSSFGWVVCVRQDDGVSELGRYIDMHYSGSGDYDYRIELLSTSLIRFGGNIYATGEITAYQSSDRRLKKDIVSISSALETIMQLDPVNFRWNNKAVALNSIKNTKTRQAGFIAQDLSEVLPESVHCNGDYLSIDEMYILPYAIAAIKEMYALMKKGGLA